MNRRLVGTILRKAPRNNIIPGIAAQRSVASDSDPEDLRHEYASRLIERGVARPEGIDGVVRAHDFFRGETASERIHSFPPAE
jgi:hypothetical protein